MNKLILTIIISLIFILPVLSKEKITVIRIDTPESRNNFKTRQYSKRPGEDIKIIISQGKRAAKFVKSSVKKGSVLHME